MINYPLISTTPPSASPRSGRPACLPANGPRSSRPTSPLRGRHAIPEGHNAYGHGLVEVAQQHASRSAPYTGLFLEEGILLMGWWRRRLSLSAAYHRHRVPLPAMTPTLTASPYW